MKIAKALLLRRAFALYKIGNWLPGIRNTNNVDANG